VNASENVGLLRMQPMFQSSMEKFQNLARNNKGHQIGVDDDLEAMRQEAGGILAPIKKTAPSQAESSKPLMHTPRDFEQPALRSDAGGSSRHFDSGRGLAQDASAARPQGRSNQPPAYSPSLFAGGGGLAPPGAAAAASAQASATFRVESIRIGIWNSGRCELKCNEDQLWWVTGNPVPGMDHMIVRMSTASIRDVLCPTHARRWDVKMVGVLSPPLVATALSEYHDFLIPKGAFPSQK
jgi:hypothetical protein